MKRLMWLMALVLALAPVLAYGIEEIKIVDAKKTEYQAYTQYGGQVWNTHSGKVCDVTVTLTLYDKNGGYLWSKTEQVRSMMVPDEKRDFEIHVDKQMAKQSASYALSGSCSICPFP